MFIFIEVIINLRQTFQMLIKNGVAHKNSKTLLKVASELLKINRKAIKNYVIKIHRGPMSNVGDNLAAS